MPILSRRNLIATALACAATSQGRAVAGQDAETVLAGYMAKLRTLTWDRRAAERIWNQSGGPRFEIVDYVDMLFEGEIHRQPAPMDATPEQAKDIGRKPDYPDVADIKEGLVAASNHYRRLGMGAPKLPIADGKFYIFLVGDMGNVAGATGPAFGVDPVFGSDTIAILSSESSRLVPKGTHLMLNNAEYLTPAPKHPFETRITMAHEMLHAIDEYMVTTDGQPGIQDGVGKWFSEGNVDAAAQYAFRSMGYRPEETLSRGERMHTKNIGMRPYDYPLTLKGVPDRRPDWVREGEGPSDQGFFDWIWNGETTEAEKADSFFAFNATYFTASFWRFLMKEEAPVGSAAGGARVEGNFELLPLLRSVVISGTDVSKANQNREWMDTGVPALDTFLRDHHPTWGATGLYRAFPAFIAHWIEWPDQTLKSRNDHLAHPKWINAMFMDGAPKREITPDRDITIELTVLPLAAKAIRFEAPQIGIGPDDYPPVTITVSIIDDGGQPRAIDNIHVGLRGQCLANGFSQPRPTGSNRVRRWASIKATPLKRRTVNDETILSFINVAPDPTTTRPVRIRVQVSLQVASTTGQVSYHPPPVETPEGTVAPPPSRSPRAPDVAPLVPVEVGVEKTTMVMIKDADLVRMMNETMDMATAMAVPRESDDGPTPPGQGMAAQVVGGVAATAFAPGAGSSGPGAGVMGRIAAPPFRIELTLPNVEPGYVGNVSGGEVAAEWHEPAYQAFAQYGVSPRVRIETDAVQVRVTSSGEGAILGTFSADFDRGSQNVEAAFRGRIEGRFSLGIAKDAAAGDEQLPEDPSVCVPTDFFIKAGRAGMSTREMRDTFRQMAEEMRASGASASSTNGATGGTTGQAGVLEPGNCRVTPAEFDAWFQELYGSQPFTAAQRTELRNQFLNAWDFTEQMICAARNAP